MPHAASSPGAKKNTRGYLTIIRAERGMVEMLIRYRDIVMKVAVKVDSGIVDYKIDGLRERSKTD